MPKSIIEAHGERIWAENNKGRGSTFIFTLPRVNGDQQGKTIIRDEWKATRTKKNFSGGRRT